MKRKFPLFTVITAMIFTISLIAFPTGSVGAEIADGTYDVDFELKEAGSDGASIADGYFNKPAKLMVENGVKHVQLTIKESEWVKSIGGPNGAASVVSEDKGSNTRTVKMQVGDLSQPVTMNMHVVVPEEIAGMEYDNDHTVRGVFDVSGLESSVSEKSEETEEGQKADSKDDSDQAGAGKTEKNPPTGDSSPIALYVILLVASIALFSIYRFRVARN